MSELKIKENVVLENVKAFVASEELQFKFYCPESYVVTDKQSLTDAEKNQKIAKAELKRIQELLANKKRFLDNAKKPLLDYEKVVIAQAEEAIKFFEVSIQDYKQKEFERQQMINRLCNEINQYKSSVIQALTNAYMQSTNGIQLLSDKCNAIIQARELKDAAERGIEFDQEIIESIEQIQEAEIVPVEIVAVEKNFVQASAIQKVEKYSVRDKNGLIEFVKSEYLNGNDLFHLLSIDVSLSAFNAWVKVSGNKNKPFVLITETNK